MNKHRAALALLCLGAIVALLLFSTERAAPDSVQAGSPYRLSFPAVRKLFPRPTATPTATATPRPTRTPSTYITIQNDLSCTLQLRLDAVNGPASFLWSIAPRASIRYHINPGAYNWHATSSCCGSASGTKYITAGYVWRFWCSSGAAKLSEEL
jgi:hypothetical protein